MQKIRDFFAPLLRRRFCIKTALEFEYGAQKPLQASFFACIIAQRARIIKVIDYNALSFSFLYFSNAARYFADSSIVYLCRSS